MLDIKWIRDNPDLLDEALKKRGIEPLSKSLLYQDRNLRQVRKHMQSMQAERNDASKRIGIIKAKGEKVEQLIAKVSKLRKQLQQSESKEKTLSKRLFDSLSAIPNIPEDDVPEGADENSNEEIKRVGKPRSFSFSVSDHVEIGEKLGGMSFERAGKLSGARFVVLTGGLARLERAISTFMLDLHTKEYGYTEASVPVLVRDNAVFGTGQLPKFSQDLFKTDEGFWLIPTAEVPLTNLVSDELISEGQLPIRLTALTNCFRSEAGAAGRDTKGMLRQHQFNKVELVSIVHPEESADELQRMTGAAEEVLKRLELPYRVMLLSAGDLGFSARKTHDLEVWLPGQNCYREISSCSTCGDFQSRRMNARFKSEVSGKPQFVHTLNGSGLAVGRALIAVIENNQNEDKTVTIPPVLQKYMDGDTVIRKDGS